ncbi:MAG: hypothetical protein J07HR59_01860, partial [Halorubrum sp. J07HR59]
MMPCARRALSAQTYTIRLDESRPSFDWSPVTSAES